MLVAKSIFCFLLAGLCEIGGGYLVWLWLREEKSVGLAVIGAVVLFLYGVIPTLQPANFGRVYAAYGASSSFFRFYGVGGSIRNCRIDSISLAASWCLLAL
jgi:drug/metabolite transporter superfamily protein YnfA